MNNGLHKYFFPNPNFVLLGPGIEVDLTEIVMNLHKTTHNTEVGVLIIHPTLLGNHRRNCGSIICQ